MSRLTTCPRCGRDVIRARTEAGRWQLLDPRPTMRGNVAAYRDGQGVWRARTVAGGRPRLEHIEKVFMPHAAGCRPRRRTLEAMSRPPGSSEAVVLPLRASTSPREDAEREPGGLAEVRELRRRR